MNDICVSYEGRWGKVGPRFQPVLVDKKYRLASEERLLLKPWIIAQKHLGPAGQRVLRTPDGISVYRDGRAVVDAEQKDAAALVGNAYQLFLLGPHYFKRSGVRLDDQGKEKVKGRECPRLLTVV
jgi:hypothetical protein